MESADGDMLLSPSYDLMNTKLHINDSQLAMNLFKEMERTQQHLLSQFYNYNISDFIEFGKRLGIFEQLSLSIASDFKDRKLDLFSFIDKSFLSDEGKRKYKEAVEVNFDQLFAK